MTVWIVCPNGRCGHADVVVAMFRGVRDRVRETRLVLARDGEGSDHEPEPGISVVYSGARGLSEALNTGLAHARRHGAVGDCFTKWDDDDLYTPHALDSYPAALAGGAVVGRRKIWVRLPDGRLWFARTGDLQGGTLAASLDCEDFPHVERCGEDRLWLDAMRRAGVCEVEVSAAGYCYRRTADVKAQACRSRGCDLHVHRMGDRRCRD